jgi:hypothetical protein
MMRKRLSHLRSRRAAALILLVWPGLSAMSTRAEVNVEGTPAELFVTTGGDAVGDVMAALAKSFDLRYRTSVRLDEAANATYSGALADVIGRVLEGYSYVVRKEQNRIDVVVVGRNGARPTPVRPPPAKSDITAKWR